MKKIIFVINNLETGGVQSSLINIVKEIHDKYNITVLSFANKPSYQNLLPPGVQLLEAKSPYKYLGFSQADMKGKPVGYIARTFWVILNKLFGRSKVIQFMNLFQKRITGYDCAISYIHEAPENSFYGGCNDFVLKNIDAKMKITWLHCDFEHCGANNEHSRNIYPKFDRIVACSDGCGKSFLRCLPDLTDKVVVIRNCNDYKAIINAASNGINYDDSFFNIVTVARLSKEKGIERGIVAVESCIKAGLQVHYHIVGSGDQENKLKQMVVDHQLENAVFFYGNRKNPYPYIINADLFLLPSYHEAAPMVFDEAACLGVPILSTKTTSTDDMILASGNGYVCDNNTEAIYENMKWILQHKDDLKMIKHNMMSKSYSNQDSIVEFAKLVE
jgi:glycosyltransferase involved in cell wall biosynthesis